MSRIFVATFPCGLALYLPTDATPRRRQAISPSQQAYTSPTQQFQQSSQNGGVQTESTSVSGSNSVASDAVTGRNPSLGSWLHPLPGRNI
ncbi:MAG TPA: hypothetical protein VN901_27925 [Candidatus Acidoferrales bacterium]|nr:hypothetical protein [Candidatus Acidoferrales bacterium]